jgi:hypothetical protein
MNRRWYNRLLPLIRIFDWIKGSPYQGAPPEGPVQQQTWTLPPDNTKSGGSKLDEKIDKTGEDGKADPQPDEPTEPGESKDLWVIDPERSKEALRKENEQPDEPDYFK